MLNVKVLITSNYFDGKEFIKEANIYYRNINNLKVKQFLMKMFYFECIRKKDILVK